MTFTSESGFDIDAGITFAARLRLYPNGRERQTIVRIGAEHDDNAVELFLNEKNDLVLQQAKQHTIRILSQLTSSFVHEWGTVCFRLIPEGEKIRLDLELSNGPRATGTFSLSGSKKLRGQVIGSPDAQFDMAKVIAIPRQLTDQEWAETQKWLAEN